MMSLLEAIRDYEYRSLIKEMKYMNQVKQKARMNMTFNSMLYMDMVYYTENCTVSRIAETLEVAKSSVTLKMNELVKLGLVEKRQDEQDKRVWYLDLTDKGYDMRRLTDEAAVETLDRIQSTLSDAEIKGFFKVMETYMEHYYDLLDRKVRDKA